MQHIKGSHGSKSVATALAIAVACGGALSLASAADSAPATGPVQQHLPFSALAKAPAALDGSARSNSLRNVASLLSVPAGSLRVAGPGVWVAKSPSGAELCVFAENAEGLGGGCFDADVARNGGAALTSLNRADGTIAKVGVVPDGYQRVVAKTADGATVDSAAVDGSAYRVSGKRIAETALTAPASGAPALSVEETTGR